MIRHIVLFQIKPEFHRDIPELIAAFYGMKGNIDGLIDLEAGADILRSDRSYDLALICTFRDRAAFDAYQDHPLHQPVRKRMHAVRTASIACDFVIPE